ncbi:MAG: DNA polymerase III subunit alpha [Clostridia bacterium]|nr:DNA polymerase III subunit alpha [Clostridia bacterium]
MAEGSAFAHLHVRSPYAFLDGASRIRELVARAAALGQPALAVTDRDSLCGAVELLEETERRGIRPILGAEVTVEPLGRAAGERRVRGYPLVLLAAGEGGYRALSRLVTRAHLENERGFPLATAEMLEEAVERGGGELFCLTGGREGEVPSRLRAGDRAGARRALERLSLIFRAGRRRGRARAVASPGPGGPGGARGEAGPLGVELVNPCIPGGRRLMAELAELAEACGLPLVAANDVRYATRDAYITHDLLACLRAGVDVSTPHPLRPLNAEHDLKPEEEMRARFAAYPEAVAEAGRWAERLSARPALRLGRDRELRPEFPLPEGADADGLLRREVYEGARRRYGRIGPRERERLEHELAVIAKLGFAPYFLLVWDVARWARQAGIRFAGRGSAADSAVAYCLGITNVDAIARGLLFERFLSLERAEKPDIDIDFDARRRDEVTAYVYRRYGREHVANVATFNTFRGRSALRDLGKALGLPEAEVDAFAKRVPHAVAADGLERALDRFPELREGGVDRAKFAILLRVAASVAGFPRHLSTHLGGVVISREPVAEVLPLQMAAKGVPIVQADRDGVEAIGLVKLDLLSLRTLAAVEEADRLLAGKVSPAATRFDEIPPGDGATYEMLNEGRTIGVFQLESPAQRALQTRLQADRFEDLVASVAIIRPGPIKGDMVEPYLRRRLGEEPVSYLHPDLAPILEKTYGVVLFQEQVIDIARTIAGFTPGEADRLRRTMSHARSEAEMAEIGRLFVEKAAARGVDRELAERIFRCLAGYASYGFNEAHAAAFADTAYRTAYLVRHHPAEFFAAVLSNQPMGYYPLHTVVADVRARGVEVRGPDVTRSEEGSTVEDGAIRLGLQLVAEVSAATRKRIVAERRRAPYRGLLDFLGRARPERDEARALALSGALDAFCGGRRRALLWALPEAFRRAAEAVPLAIVAAGGAGSGAPDPPGLLPDLPDFSPEERVAHEWAALGVPLTAHPMAFWRERLRRRGYLTTDEVARAPAGRLVRVAGLPVRPHRPPTKSGRIVVYVSLEDEFGLADVVVFEDVYQRDGAALFGERLPALAVLGVVERRGKGVQIVARRVAELGRGRRRASSPRGAPRG